MLSTDRRLANAVGGISARACDSCVKKRARWYCAADDAFLCQCCDASVHSANPLARRHERVRLKSIRLMNSDDDESGPAGLDDISVQSCWHQGFTRKARTPRHKKSSRLLCSDDHEPVVSGSSNPSPLVPEISSEECTRRGREKDDELDLILHQVPVFDVEIGVGFGGHVSDEFSLEEEDLSEFAADFESLLGKGIEDAAWFDMERFEIERTVKTEDAGPPTDAEFTHLKFVTDDNSQEDNKKQAQDDHRWYQKKIFHLSLDYDGVMSAWDGKKSPWTTGERPDLKNSSDECWPYCLLQGTCATVHESGGGGREARVMRYREKRRTRLFSKKIRYQVRKLNAEKRPRIKGRFVKTPNFHVEQQVKAHGPIKEDLAQRGSTFIIGP